VDFILIPNVNIFLAYERHILGKSPILHLLTHSPPSFETLIFTKTNLDAAQKTWCVQVVPEIHSLLGNNLNGGVDHERAGWWKSDDIV